MPHISVMIPNFNHAHLIGETIESVLNQTFKDFDIVVVDDASTDNSVHVINEYVQANDRVRLVVNEKNLGLVRNWNKCLDLAEGPLVQIMQSDDLIDPDYFAAVAETFDRYPEVGMVAATARRIDDTGAIIGESKAKDPQYYHAGDEAITALLLGGYPHVTSIVVRRECYETMGKYDESIWHGPDMEYDARIVSKYDFYHFGRVYSSFRRHGMNMGILRTLRDDFMQTEIKKRRMTVSYLSAEGRAKLGIHDVDHYVFGHAAQAAVSGSLVMMAFGRFALSRRYLLQALRLSPSSTLRNDRFWRALASNLVPPAGKWMANRHIHITDDDRKRVEAVVKSLETQRSK